MVRTKDFLWAFRRLSIVALTVLGVFVALVYISSIALDAIWKSNDSAWAQDIADAANQYYGLFATDTNDCLLVTQKFLNMNRHFQEVLYRSMYVAQTAQLLQTLRVNTDVSVALHYQQEVLNAAITLNQLQIDKIVFAPMVGKRYCLSNDSSKGLMIAVSNIVPGARV